MIFTITAVCILLSLLYYYYAFERKLSRIKKLTSNMPHPKHYPIIGCALEFGTRSDEILNNFNRIFNEHGSVVAACVGNEFYVLLCGVNEIQTVLSNNKQLKKAHVYEFLHPWLGNGLLTSDGANWHKQRKIITPAFHFKILELFVDMFSANIDILSNKLKHEVGKPGFNVTDYIVLCTLDIISETSMGIQINAQLEKENEFARAIHDVTFAVLYRAIKPWLFPRILFDISPTGISFNKKVKLIHNFIQELIDNKRKQRAEGKVVENEKESDETSFAYGQKKKAAFLDLLIDYDLTDEEILNQVNTFMFAGHDTTTSAISFTIYCLMKYPEVQEKVLNEQKEILGDSNRPPGLQDLKSMKYLEHVVEETLRLYPSVPYIGRQMTEDFQLTPEYIIPKGCSVNLFLYKLLRDPELFPDPEVFNPDRFLPEAVVGRNPFAHCPFSAGPRNCIGQKFAMLEIKSVISAIVRKFKILPPIDCPDIVLGSELVLRSLTGVYIRLENR
ncbi:cytochrome P450 4C1-like isoform X3 [Lycorma delicatula]|uniref:cytochrome P450 4C1-like isoform X3 n=1 Tax=Lycorma delicatula TaxID=130591 RepID=UPI003F50FD57